MYKLPQSIADTTILSVGLNDLYIDFPFLNSSLDRFLTYVLVILLTLSLFSFFCFIKSRLIFNSNIYSTQGFTLIELMVVIVILAILAVVGAALFTTVQSKARDSKRRADIVAISKAMETNYVAGTGYVTTVAAGWFADSALPSNPTPGGAAYSTSGATVSSYTFCAALENSTGNAMSATGTSLGITNGSFFCKKNAQ